MVGYRQEQVYVDKKLLVEFIGEEVLQEELKSSFYNRDGGMFGIPCPVPWWICCK